MNRLMPEHGAPKTMTYLPENEPELMIILKRERPQTQLSCDSRKSGGIS